MVLTVVGWYINRDGTVWKQWLTETDGGWNGKNNRDGTETDAPL